MIAIHVQLRGVLRGHAPPTSSGRTVLALPVGATVADLVQALGIAADEELDGAIGERIARWDDVLHDGDEVILFPPLAGG